MKSWENTRLMVVIDEKTDDPVCPIESVQTTFNTPAEVVHSLEATHIGYIASPENITFTMTVKAIGTWAAKLTRIAMDGQQFKLCIYETTETPGEWDFTSVALDHCLITSANPSNATVNGAPMATFSGVSRKAAVEDKPGGESSIPSFTG